MSKNNTGRSAAKTGRKKGWLVFVCTLLTVFMSSCADKSQNTSIILENEFHTSGPVNYNTIQVREGDYSKTISGSASVIYLVETNLFWEKETAYCREVLVKSGQEVKEGDILMSFDTKDDRLQSETLKLQLSKEKETIEENSLKKLEELENAKRKAKDKTGYEQKIAEKKIEKMQAAFEQYLYESQKKVLQIEAQMEELKQAGKENVLLAPFDGVIKEVQSYNVGDKVTNGQLLVTMYSTDKLLLNAADSAGKLRYNMPVTLEVGNKKNSVSYTGRVIAAPNILVPLGYQCMTLIEFDENVTEKELKGSIKYHADGAKVQGVLLIERKATQREDGKTFVHILENDSVHKRYVATYDNSSQEVWVLDGLMQGQTLIVD